jgi:NAD(P)H-hydrate repair Nnr-like enzyme with NAD(P)H-hydrate dehydratase domain
MNLTPELIRPLLKPRDKFSHKGNYGHALLIAGSYGKIGAAVLAAKACLRSGVGLLTVHLPACGYTIMQTTNPEAMVRRTGMRKYLQLISIQKNLQPSASARDWERITLHEKHCNIFYNRSNNRW